MQLVLRCLLDIRSSLFSNVGHLTINGGIFNNAERIFYGSDTARTSSFGSRLIYLLPVLQVFIDVDAISSFRQRQRSIFGDFSGREYATRSFFRLRILRLTGEQLWPIRPGDVDLKTEMSFSSRGSYGQAVPILIQTRTMHTARIRG